MKRPIKSAGIVVAAIGFFAWYYFALPEPLFTRPYSTVLEDEQGELLSAAIAHDGQWRFPQLDTVPEKFKEALILFEDKRFYRHPGIDVLSLARAVKQNIQAGDIVSGGSTITMQVVRLWRNQPRTYFEKLFEIILATRLEWRYSKDEILSLYASHAPFGGNVVGLEAACWRYFHRQPDELSWGEAALLAVLPNSPSLIHPGKNRNALLAKRNRLLERLHKAGKLDEVELDLAKAEDLPEQPVPLPRLATHLLDRSIREGLEQRKVRSTLRHALQVRAEQIVRDHSIRLSGNLIYNAAVIVAEVETGKVLAYVGNTGLTGDDHGQHVDIISARRSTGSILKPVLYAAMLDEGKLLPKTLLPDVPTIINGFAPKNFSKDYDGVVPADEALIRSLNVPAVHMLQEYRYEKLYALLKQMGIGTLTALPDHYGLSLILGGAEGTLWDITSVYASMARVLNRFSLHNDERYATTDYHSLTYLQSPTGQQLLQAQENPIIHAAALFQTFTALTEVNRPGEETGWKNFSGSRKIAWKTGTSFGFRDGWAVGVTPEYVVGVWTGNADGEGRPGLTGSEAAAPILFDIFSILPATTWFNQPYSEMEQVSVCAKSGMRSTILCERTDTIWVAEAGLTSKPCSFHQIAHLSKDGRYRVHASCEPLDNLMSMPWFVLPPVQEHYYKTKNMSYKPLPPFRKDCTATASVASMELVYPKENTRIFIPRELNGSCGRSVFELAHRNPASRVYWHLNGTFIGITQNRHQMALNPGPGKHVLVLIDQAGEPLERHFEVLSN
ncbi:MAG: penicillin-binding protein 1C [Cyclobacteriaceae bacterium]|nr:penicillin-binding protein 1C [Cyclobacteriaceae bacterium]QOI97399.1 MAG: penicillin-binding protein 1C [Flammeovirgaceae bacterium]